MKCKNCQTEFDGKFCNACGQNIRVEKLTLKSFFEEVSDSIFQINHGLFYTIISLFQRPGYSIRYFLDGQRKHYFKPIAYVLLLSTAYYLITRIFEIDNLIEDAVDGINLSREEHREPAEKMPILNWFSSNFAYAILLLIPFFSIATYISFVNKSYNYLEHIVINSYITGQQFIFYCLMAILDALLGKEDLMISFALIISFIYRFWTFTQLFNKNKTIKVILRLFLAYILFFVLIFLLMTFATAINLLLNRS